MTLTVLFECVLPCISIIVYPEYENGQRKRLKGTERMGEGELINMTRAWGKEKF